LDGGHKPVILKTISFSSIVILIKVAAEMVFVNSGGRDGIYGHCGKMVFLNSGGRESICEQ
jgi:hypothetical protein